MNVLITGCSRHSSEIVDCLKNNYENRPVKVVAVDSDENNVLTHNTDSQYIVPRSASSDYIPELLKICKKEKIDIIIPYITSELVKMSSCKGEFENQGVHVSVSGEESVRILNSKVNIAAEFGDYMPEQIVVRDKEEAIKALDLLDYPHSKVCIKATDSCGGNGFAIIEDCFAYNIMSLNKRGQTVALSKSEMLQYSERNTLIIQKYVKGKDYSLCVLADNGKIIASCGYYGYSMEYGAVTNGEIAANESAFSIASDVVSRTSLCGNACFDFLIDSCGKAILLECNPRINASLGFCNAAGINLVYLRCKHLLGEDFNADQFKIKYGLKMRKFYESEYYV